MGNKIIYQKYKRMYDEFATKQAKKYLEKKFSPSYFIGFTGFLRETSLLRKLKIQPEDIILDVGCASGHQSFIISRHCKKAIGIDVGLDFIEEAQNYARAHHIQNIEFKVADVENLPFKTEAFDKIICAEVLEHVINPSRALEEMKRVLKKKGRLVISVPNMNSNGTLWGRLKRLLGIRKFIPIEVKDFSMGGIEKHGDSHLREFNSKALQNIIKEHNFEVDYLDGLSFLDWPRISLVYKMLSKFKSFQKIFLNFELLLTKIKIFTKFGRHLILVAIKE